MFNAIAQLICVPYDGLNRYGNGSPYRTHLFHLYFTYFASKTYHAYYIVNKISKHAQLFTKSRAEAERE